MKFVAKDFNNKTNLIDAMMSIRSQFTENPTITIVGIPDVATNTGLRQLKFKLLPEDSTLETEQLSYSILEKICCWTHAEAMISNVGENEQIPWVSESVLKKISNTWARFDEILVNNTTDLEDYLYKVNTEKKSSYTLTRDELMLLLSLQGGQTLRQVVLGKDSDPADLLAILFNSMAHKLLTKKSYDPNADYSLTIKAMGDRINTLSKNASAFNGATKLMLSDLFMHDLVLLAVKYPDTECIGVSCDTIDVSETVSALLLTKDAQYTCSVGSSILKPLNIIYASIASSLVWSFGFDKAVELLVKTDKELTEKYKSVKSEKKPHFLRSV